MPSQDLPFVAIQTLSTQEVSVCIPTLVECMYANIRLTAELTN